MNQSKHLITRAKFLKRSVLAFCGINMLPSFSKQIMDNTKSKNKWDENFLRTVVARIAERLDMNYVYFSGCYPGTLMTHFEILNSENQPFKSDKRSQDLFTRHWGKAEIRLDSGKLITLHSVHLNPKKYFRLAEILEIQENSYASQCSRSKG